MGYGKFNFLYPRNAPVFFIHRVVCPCVRQGINPVKFFGRKAFCRRILHKHFISVPLYNRFPVNFVLLVILYPACPCISFFIFADLCKAWTFRRSQRSIFRLCKVASPPYIRNRAYILTRIQSMGKFGYLMFRHSIKQNIRPAVHKNRRPYRIIPIIIMGKSPE